MINRPLDLAGIGIGPFNLSLAAQLDAIDELEACFFERRERFCWHEGMMLPEVELQTSFLKDLVTAVNPTSPWSFMAYLVSHKRFYSFIHAEFEATPRKEFASYLAWVAQSLKSLRFGADVRDIAFVENAFLVQVNDDRLLARNIALGVGRSPAIPPFARPHLGSKCFHSSQAAEQLAGTGGGRVAVVGGGQSGAEIVLHLLSRAPSACSELTWISRRQNFAPLDATPFTNELFTPDYVERFRRLGEERRHAALTHQKLAGDGISPATLRAIYRRLYRARHLGEGNGEIALLPHREVIQMDRQKDELRLIARNGFDGSVEVLIADTVILATGHCFEVPECLAPLKDRIAFDRRGNLSLGDDFSVRWDGPRHNRIFALNAGLHSHGIAEPQLSLMAWRSAVIVNALLGRPHFDLDVPPSMVGWTMTADGSEAVGTQALVGGST